MFVSALRRLHRVRARLRPCAAMAVLLVSFSSAFAATLTWDGGGGAIPANWFDLGNWDAPNNLQLDHDLVFGTGFDSGTSILIGHVSGAPANTITINTTTGFTINGLFSGGFRPIHLATGQLSRVDVAGVESNHVINTVVNLEANGVWNINGSGLLSVKSIDESGGSFSLQKTGTGTLVLSEAGGYTGGTTVSTGALRAQSNTSLGSGAVSVATGAALELDSALVNLPLTLNGAGISSGGALRAHAGVNSWSGGITLNTNSTIGVSSGASLSISGVITDGGLTRTLTKTGLGTLTLSNANTIDGNTTVSEGPLWLADNLALGPSNIVTVAGGAALIIGDGTDLSITNTASISGDGMLGAGVIRSQTGVGALSGPISMTGASSIGGQAGSELLLKGQIGGAFPLTKVGAGTVTLAAPSSYSGATTVAEGILKVRHPTALSPAGTTVSDGATLAIQETIALAAVSNSRPISLNGTGVGNLGVLRSISNNNTWSGAVTLQSHSNVGVDADQLTVSGAITGAFNLTKVGPGTLQLTNAANNYTSTIVDEGTLSIIQPNAIPAGTSITVNDGGTVRVQGGITVARVLHLNGGGLDGNGALRSAGGTNTWSSPVTLQSHSAFNVTSGEMRITAEIGGAGGLFKTGPGKLSLLFGNSYGGPTNVEAGVLSLEHTQGIAPGSITFVLPTSAIDLRGGIAPANPLFIAGTGILNGGALRNVQANNTWAGPITINSIDGAVGADAGTQLTLSGVVTDALDHVYPFTKVGAGTVVLSNVNTYDGGTLINGGTLSISADNNLGAAGTPVTNNNGGKLLVTANTTSSRTFNLNTGSLQVEGTATLTYTNTTVNGGFLRGPGTHAIGANSTFSGVTALNGTNITQSQPTTLVNFTNAGNLTSSSTLTWDGGFNTSAGNISVNSTFNTQAFENAGVITINPGGSINNTTSPLVSGGGGRITINNGGILNGGPGIELNGSLLVNNGTITGTTNVNFGSLAKGSGTYGAINVTDGGRFSPGNSPGVVNTGSANWNPGGSYLVEIADATGAAGEGFDSWLIDGVLNVDSLSTPSGRFTISVSSLDSIAANFDSTRDYAWTILHASGGIAGFEPSELNLDTSAFKNPHTPGQFTIEATSNDLLLRFSGVPEPAQSSMILLAAAFISRRSRKMTT